MLDDVPVILTDNVINATEDELYSVDYDSDDDMVYEVTWYLTTNAGFLSINDTTGELSGLPENSDVGDWWVNVSTENYLGDRDFTNFTTEDGLTNNWVGYFTHR